MADALIIGDRIGGQPKQRYWTPDGREILTAANMHGTSDGGVRDANYDKGWLPSKPTELKLYCPHCDRWHDTKVEVTNCGEKKATSSARYMKWAKKNTPKDGNGKGEIDGLKAELAEMKKLLNKLVARKEKK